MRLVVEVPRVTPRSSGVYWRTTTSSPFGSFAFPPPPPEPPEEEESLIVLPKKRSRILYRAVLGTPSGGSFSFGTVNSRIILFKDSRADSKRASS